MLLGKSCAFVHCSAIQRYSLLVQARHRLTLPRQVPICNLLPC